MAEKKIIETIEFDDYAYAKDVLEESTMKLEKIKTGMLVAAAATFCSFLSLVFSGIDGLNSLFWLMGLGGSIAAYIIGGGIKIALNAAVKLAYVGWLIIPFPWDLVTGACTLIFAFISFLFVPIIFVYINYRQNKKNRDDAETYLRYCKQTTTTVEDVEE